MIDLVAFVLVHKPIVKQTPQLFIGFDLCDWPQVPIVGAYCGPGVALDTFSSALQNGLFICSFQKTKQTLVEMSVPNVESL